MEGTSTLFPRFCPKEIKENPTLQKLNTDFIGSQCKMFLIQPIPFKDGVEIEDRVGVGNVFLFLHFSSNGKIGIPWLNQQECIYYLALFEIISTMFRISIKSIKFFQAQNKNKNTNINCISCFANISLCDHNEYFPFPVFLSPSLSFCLSFII